MLGEGLWPAVNWEVPRVAKTRSSAQKMTHSSHILFTKWFFAGNWDCMKDKICWSTAKHKNIYCRSDILVHFMVDFQSPGSPGARTVRATTATEYRRPYWRGELVPSPEPRMNVWPCNKEGLGEVSKKGRLTVHWQALGKVLSKKGRLFVHWQALGKVLSKKGRLAVHWQALHSMAIGAFLLPLCMQGFGHLMLIII